MIEEEVLQKTLRCFAPCSSGHLTGGYVASPSVTPKFTFGKFHIFPRTLGLIGLWQAEDMINKSKVM